jgi:hypothetical protein
LYGLTRLQRSRLIILCVGQQPLVAHKGCKTVGLDHRNMEAKLDKGKNHKAKFECFEKLFILIPPPAAFNPKEFDRDDKVFIGLEVPKYNEAELTKILKARLKGTMVCD